MVTALPAMKWKHPYFLGAERRIAFFSDIGCLSDDLLLLIFQTLFRIVGGDKSRVHYTALGALRLVSRRWDGLICSQREFWGRLCLDQPPEGWDVVFKYNSTGLLHVFAVLAGYNHPWAWMQEYDGPERPPSDPKATKFLSLIFDAKERIKTLDILFDGGKTPPVGIMLLLLSPAPVLEVIYLRALSVNTPSHRSLVCFPLPGGLFSGYAPTIRSLHIQSDFTPTQPVPAFLGGRLEHLCLRNVGRCSHPGASSPSTFEFLPEILRHSPHLKSIKLAKCTLSTPLHVNPEDSITLKQLRSLAVTQCTENIILFMFDVVDAPFCSDLALEITAALSPNAHLVVSQRMANNFMPKKATEHHHTLHIYPHHLIRTPSCSVSSQYKWADSPSRDFGLESVFNRMADDVKAAISSVFLFEETATRSVFPLLHETFPHLAELGLDCRGRPGVWNVLIDPPSDPTPLLENENMLPGLKRFQLMGTARQTGLMPKAIAILGSRRARNAASEKEDQPGDLQLPVMAPVATIILGQPEISAEIMEQLRITGVGLEFNPWLNSVENRNC